MTSGDLGIGGSGESGVRDLGSREGELVVRLCAAGKVADLCEEYIREDNSLNRCLGAHEEMERLTTRVLLCKHCHTTTCC